LDDFTTESTVFLSTNLGTHLSSSEFLLSKERKCDDPVHDQL
jgi:hypothetical protein